MSDSPRMKFARQSDATAAASPGLSSAEPKINTRPRAIVRQTRETVERVERSERTDNAGRPR